MDATSTHHYTPKILKGSKKWVKHCESAPKSPKMQQSTGKVMATVFWDAHEAIFMNYLQKGRTITRAHYAALLD